MLQMKQQLGLHVNAWPAEHGWSRSIYGGACGRGTTSGRIILILTQNIRRILQPVLPTSKTTAQTIVAFQVGSVVHLCARVLVFAI